MDHVINPELAPFLDLFSRMTDAQIARLTGVPPAEVRRQRQEVYDIMDRLEPFEDLLERLDDEALVRLTEQPLDTVAFWRACCVAPERIKRSRDTSSDTETSRAATTPSSPRDTAGATTSPATAPSIEVEEEEDDDVFVLTIDEDEPSAGAGGGTNGPDDDAMDWADL